jgi:putative glutamine amidotransferase
VAPRPAIGICAAIERVRWGPWEETVTLAPRSYATAVQRAGGIALLLPPDPELTDSPDELLDRLDGVMLAGGSDVDPASYGADPDEETGATWPDRDTFELALLRRAIEREIPALGICRGMQMLNVARGGTLDQHVPRTLGHEDHRLVPGTFGDHEVRLATGTLAQRAAGGEKAAVRSHHHQGVDELGDGLEVTGWSQADELIEAIEIPDAGYALGVLWHPEEDAESNVIPSLVEAARGRAQAAPGREAEEAAQ